MYPLGTANIEIWSFGTSLYLERKSILHKLSHPIFLQVYGVILSTFRSRLKLSNICYHNKIYKIEISVYIQVYIQVYIHVCCTSKVIGRKDASHFKQHTYIKTLLLVFKSLFKYLLSQNFMLRIKELNLTCMINDSERITEKLGQYLVTARLQTSL